MKNVTKKAMDYSVLANAIASAYASRRTALQVELAVGLVHFAMENNNTDTSGKSNLKSVYHGGGYMCLSKGDRDYQTVNRRINACANLFDKLGSRTVHGWIESCAGDTAATLAYVVTELQAYALETMDDVLHFVGMNSNKSAKKVVSKSGPVEVIKPEAESAAAQGEGEAASAPKLDIEALPALLLAQCDDAALNSIMEKLMDGMAQRATAALKVA